LRPSTGTLSNMRAEAILILVFSSVVVTTGLLILLRRHAAHGNFNRVIARFERDLASPIPLVRRLCGIETFDVEGALDSEPVHARWDGSWVILSTVLYERVALALAVEEALAEAGLAPQCQSATFRQSPEEFMLAVLTCCDYIDVAEFEIRGHRRVITADVGYSLPRFRQD
jgi:hypothetical protein